MSNFADICDFPRLPKAVRAHEAALQAEIAIPPHLLLPQDLPRSNDEVQFEIGGQEDDLAWTAFGLEQDIRAASRAVLRAGLTPQEQHWLAPQDQKCGSPGIVENDFPIFRSLDGLAGFEHHHMRNGGRQQSEKHMKLSSYEISPPCRDAVPTTSLWQPLSNAA